MPIGTPSAVVSIGSRAVDAFGKERFRSIAMSARVDYQGLCASVNARRIDMPLQSSDMKAIGLKGWTASRQLSANVTRKQKLCILSHIEGKVHHGWSIRQPTSLNQRMHQQHTCSAAAAPAADASASKEEGDLA